MSLHNISSSFVTSGCNLVVQGFEKGACELEVNGKLYPACKVVLRRKENVWYRLIFDIELSRPEDYLSIYMSGCNHKCLKCHSWYFTQHPRGTWMSTDEIADEVALYEQTMVNVWEPRYRATMWHARVSLLTNVAVM